MTDPTTERETLQAMRDEFGPFIKLDLPPSGSGTYAPSWKDPRLDKSKEDRIDALPDHFVDAMRYSLALKMLPVVGYFRIGDFKIAIHYRPAWHKRFLMKHLLGWTWEEA